MRLLCILSGTTPGLSARGPLPEALPATCHCHPADWLEFVNDPQSTEELEPIRRSVNWGCPFADDQWREQTVRELGLESTMRDPGRPRRAMPAGEAR
jgi:hypothetical protein